MNTINIHKWEMGILTNVKNVPSLTLKTDERSRNKIQNGFYLRENGIERKQVDFVQKAKHLKQNKLPKMNGSKEIQKNIKLIPQFIMHCVLENSTGIHVAFAEQKPKHTMKITANLLR